MISPTSVLVARINSINASIGLPSISEKTMGSIDFSKNSIDHHVNRALFNYYRMASRSFDDMIETSVKTSIDVFARVSGMVHCAISDALRAEITKVAQDKWASKHGVSFDQAGYAQVYYNRQTDAYDTEGKYYFDGGGYAPASSFQQMVFRAVGDNIQSLMPFYLECYYAERLRLTQLAEAKKIEADKLALQKKAEDDARAAASAKQDLTMKLDVKSRRAAQRRQEQLAKAQSKADVAQA